MRLKINWDALGVATTVACAIHCALLPLLLTSLPLFGINLIENHYFEYGMIALAFSIGAYSFYHGYRKHHHSAFPFLIFVLGILLLIAKMQWHQWSLLFLFPAVACIIIAHVVNYKSCRVHNHAHDDDCNH